MSTGPALSPSSPAPNMAKLQAFMGQAVSDMGASLHAVLVLLGDRLGLYKAMADGQPISPAVLADRTSTSERYVREWLNANAASGYVLYDPHTQTYTLPPEQAMALAIENSPAFIPGAFQIISACFNDADRIEQAFRTGAGMGWHEHHHDLFHGTERFFRSGYLAHLTTSWIPALDGVVAKLERGGKVADVGCGLGASTILMAKTYPNSEFFGLRLPRGIDRSRPRLRPARRPRRPDPLRRRARQGLPRHRTTTWSPSSTACTTSATPSAPPPTSAPPSSPTAPG